MAAVVGRAVGPADREDVGVDHLALGQVLADVAQVVDEVGVVDGADRALAEVADGQPLDVGQVVEGLEDHVHPGGAFDISALVDVVQGVLRRAEDLERAGAVGAS